MAFTLRHCVAISLSLCAGLGAQATTPPKLGSFFPKDYTHEFFIDVTRILDSDLGDELERSLLIKGYLAYLRKDVGISGLDLTSVRGGGAYSPRKGRSMVSILWELRGTKPFALPPVTKTQKTYPARFAIKLAGRDAIQQGHDAKTGDPQRAYFLRPKAYVIPDAKRMIFGDKELVQSVLTGKRRGGVPHPQLMALTAGKRPLAYLAGGLVRPDGSADHNFPAEWLVANDPPKQIMIRLHQNKTDEHIVVTGKVRFTNGKGGPAQFHKSLKAALENLRKKKQMGPLVKYLDRLTFAVDGADLNATLDAGTARETGKLVALVASVFPMMLMRDTPAGGMAPVVNVKSVEAEALVPVPAKPKPKPKARKKGTEK